MSKFFRLNGTDFLKGLIMLVISTLLSSLIVVLGSADFHFDWEHMRLILLPIIIAVLTYLSKNLITNSDGKIKLEDDLKLQQ